MKIVPISEIPTETIAVPLDNLLDLYSKAQQMEILCVSNRGVGLAAVQVGIPWKFFIYCDEDNKFHYMIDCEYSPVGDDRHVSIEGCLSIKTNSGGMRHFKVMRYNSINVVGKELLINDKLEVVDFQKTINKSLECAIFQHEIDHHNNMLISSIGEEFFLQRA
jgi:peptide deformylase